MASFSSVARMAQRYWSQPRNLRRRMKSRPHVEQLESRELLSTFVVTNNRNSGPGSLRQAIIDANATTAADVVEFNVDGPVNSRGLHHVHIQTALPVIKYPLVIDGTTQPGYDGSPLFEIHGREIVNPANGLYFTPSAINSGVKGLSVWDFESAGVWLAGPNQFVESCVLWENDSGVRVGRTTGATILGNELHTNWYAGIETIGGESHLIDGNNAHGNLYGLVMYGTDDSHITHNDFNSNALSGINAGSGISLNRFDYNTITDNGEYGCRIVTGAVGTIFSNNTVTGNQIGGVLVAGGGTHDTEVSDNQITGNGLYGVLFGSTNNNSVSRNLISGHSVSGIHLSVSSYNGLDDNDLTDNGVGIYVVGNFNTGSGNDFSGNGDDVVIQSGSGNGIE